eukprot:363836-Chlamydomonas_euryale.AAC.2
MVCTTRVVASLVVHAGQCAAAPTRPAGFAVGAILELSSLPPNPSSRGVPFACTPLPALWSAALKGLHCAASRSPHTLVRCSLARHPALHGVRSCSRRQHCLNATGCRFRSYLHTLAPGCRPTFFLVPFSLAPSNWEFVPMHACAAEAAAGLAAIIALPLHSIWKILTAARSVTLCTPPLVPPLRRLPRPRNQTATTDEPNALLPLDPVSAAGRDQEQGESPTSYPPSDKVRQGWCRGAATRLHGAMVALLAPVSHPPAHGSSTILTNPPGCLRGHRRDLAPTRGGAQCTRAPQLTALVAESNQCTEPRTWGRQKARRSVGNSHLDGSCPLARARCDPAAIALEGATCSPFPRQGARRGHRGTLLRKCGMLAFLAMPGLGRGLSRFKRVLMVPEHSQPHDVMRQLPRGLPHVPIDLLTVADNGLTVCTVAVQMTDMFKDATKAVQDQAHAAAEAARQTKDSVMETAKQGLGKSEDTAKQGRDTVEDTAKQGWEKTAGAAEQTKEKAADIAQQGKETVTGATEQGKEEAADTYEQGKEATQGAAEQTGDAAKQAGESASTKAEETKGAATEKVEQAREATDM